MWTHALDLSAAARDAGGKFRKYKSEVKEARFYPTQWKLDDHLGGALLKPPNVFGTLVVSRRGCRLKVDGEAAVLRTFGELAGRGHRQATKRNNEQEALTQKSCRQRALRANNRRTLHESPHGGIDTNFPA